MKKITLIFVIACSSFLMFSCMEDEGSYEYNDINEIEISGVENIYTVLQFDSLQITPTIDQTFYQDEEHLEFAWYVSNQGIDTLSLERNLNVPISLRPDDYLWCYFVVTDTNTGVFFKKRFSVSVLSSLGTGLLVLSELNGQAQLGYIFQGGVIEDVYGQTSGGHIGENPVKVSYHFQARNSPAYISVMCSDESGGKVIDPLSFETLFNFRDIFFIPPGTALQPPMGYTFSNITYKVMQIYGASYTRDFYYDWVLVNGKVHERFAYGAATKFTAPYVADELGYEVSHILGFFTGGFVYMYDRKNNRFLQRSSNWPNNQASPVNIAAGERAWEPHDVGEGMEMLFWDYGYTVGLVNSGMYMFMDDGNASYFLKAEVPYTSLKPTVKKELPFRFEEGSSFAHHLATPASYYSGEGHTKIFSLDTESLIVTEQHNFGSGNVISCMWSEPTVYVNESGQNTFGVTRLYVGVSGADVLGNGQVGSVYVFDMNFDNTLTLVEQHNNIAGRIVDFSWKYR